MKLLVLIILIGGLCVTLLSFVIGFNAEFIMSLLFGPEFVMANDILVIFSATILISFLGVMFGYPAFSVLNKIKVANYTVMIGALCHIVQLYILYSEGRVNALSVVSAVLITEFIVLTLRVVLFCYFFQKSNKHPQTKPTCSSNVVDHR